MCLNSGVRPHRCIVRLVIGSLRDELKLLTDLSGNLSLVTQRLGGVLIRQCPGINAIGLFGDLGGIANSTEKLVSVIATNEQRRGEIGATHTCKLGHELTRLHARLLRHYRRGIGLRLQLGLLESGFVQFIERLVINLTQTSSFFFGFGRGNFEPLEDGHNLFYFGLSASNVFPGLLDFLPGRIFFGVGGAL